MFYHSVVSQNTCLSSPELRVLIVEHNDQHTHTVTAHVPISSEICDWCDHEPKLMPLQFQVPLVSNWLGFKLLWFETEVAEQGLTNANNSHFSITFCLHDSTSRVIIEWCTNIKYILFLSQLVWWFTVHLGFGITHWMGHLVKCQIYGDLEWIPKPAWIFVWQQADPWCLPLELCSYVHNICTLWWTHALVDNLVDN